MWPKNFQMYNKDLERGRGTRDQITNICWIIEKAKELQKKTTSASCTMLKPLIVLLNCGARKDSWESLQLQGDQINYKGN